MSITYLSATSPFHESHFHMKLLFILSGTSYYFLFLNEVNSVFPFYKETALNIKIEHLLMQHCNILRRFRIITLLRNFHYNTVSFSYIVQSNLILLCQSLKCKRVLYTMIKTYVLQQSKHSSVKC